MMELYERIALARKQANLSQEQLGEKLGVSRQAVSKWESGQTNPDISYIAEMCRVFGVTSDWLLLGKTPDQAHIPACCPNCQTIVTGLDKYCPNCGRSLTSQEEPTYTMLLKNGEYIARIPAVLASLSKTGLFPADSVLAQPIEECPSIIDHVPCILARGLTLKQVQEIREKIQSIDCYSSCFFDFYQDHDGSTPEELADKIPLSQDATKKPAEPLSFGMIVLAVVLGIIIASFL